MKITRGKPVEKPKFIKQGKLPGKPSALIKIALDDLRRAEKSRKFTVYMYEWVAPEDHAMASSRCTVCLAGSVMVGTLKLNIDDLKGGASPNSDFPKEQPALYAIDDFRQGSLAAAFVNLHLDFPGHFLEEVDIIEYDEDPGQFKRQMSGLARTLEKEGY